MRYMLRVKTQPVGYRIKSIALEEAWKNGAEHRAVCILCAFPYIKNYINFYI